MIFVEKGEFGSKVNEVKREFLWREFVLKMIRIFYIYNFIIITNLR